MSYQYERCVPFHIEYEERLALQCQARITEVLWDILRNESKTQYAAIYDAIYCLVEDDVINEQNGE